MTAYDIFVDEGDRLRERVHKPAMAIDYYECALARGGPRDRHCEHMIGVCLQMTGWYEEAIVRYKKLLLRAFGTELSAILRDMAESYGAMGDLQEAQDCINRSLLILSVDQYPAEHATSLGFLGRLQVRQGQLDEAVTTFEIADRELHRAGAHKRELYNKLHYASALSRLGRHDDMMRVIGQVLTLIPDHGSPAHLRRAKALLLGGWRAEAALSRIRRAPLTVRQWLGMLLSGLHRSSKA